MGGTFLRVLLLSVVNGRSYVTKHERVTGSLEGSHGLCLSVCEVDVCEHMCMCVVCVSRW